jgi:octaprenyl-diphosphate synthase
LDGVPVGRRASRKSALTLATSALAGDASRLLAECTARIAPELAEVERILAAEMSSALPPVQKLVEHCSRLRGKRLRPILVLLSARACGGIRPEHKKLAAVIEMIHTATLVHDDILDDAVTRRHSPTVSAAWGNERAVLMGDYLFARAYHLAATLDSTLACRWIGAATTLVCEGEIQQVENRGNLDLTEAGYLQIVRGKTAELTAVACRLGAHYAGAKVAETDVLEHFGRDLGVAFQIADDVLDLWGEEWVTGKSLGTDLAKQKLTLPVIHYLNTADPAARERMRSELRRHEAHARESIRDELEAHGALDYAWYKAHEFAASAREALCGIPPSLDREALSLLAGAVVKRGF